MTGKIIFGTTSGIEAECRTCGYFCEIQINTRTRHFCAWTGEKLPVDAATFACAGYHAGEWGQLWAV